MSVISRIASNAFKCMLTRNAQLRANYRSTNPLISADNLSHATVLGPLFDGTFIKSDSAKIQNDQKSKNDLIETSIQLWKNNHLCLPKDDLEQISKHSNICVSKGIRDSLEMIMRFFFSNSIFYLPSDVYPVYEQIANNVGVESKIYQTMKPYPITRQQQYPIEDLVQISKSVHELKFEIAVLADPLPYLPQNADKMITDDATSISNDICKELTEWLSQSNRRYIIIDSVYRTSFNKNLLNLISTRKVFYLNSLSKSHCSPYLFGCNLIPNHIGDLKETFENSISTESLKTAISLMGLYPQNESMKFQRKLFQEGRKNLNASLITRGFPKLLHVTDETPYIFMYHFSHDNLYSNGILGIPMDVYERPDLKESYSIMSVLNDVDNIIKTQNITLPKTMYHVTTLSNFAKGYDKYTNTFSKLLIPESTFSDKFHLITSDDVQTGIEKAKKLLSKLNIPNDKLLLIETKIPGSVEILRTENTNKGYYIKSGSVNVDGLYTLTSDDDNGFIPNPLNRLPTENVVAQSMLLHKNMFKPFDQILPRSVSILPIAQGCQAKCDFCFSHSSVSDDVKQRKMSNELIENMLKIGKVRGSERAVITGGGEPTMIPHHLLLTYIQLCRKYYNKVVLITNGYNYSNKKVDEQSRLNMLKDLQANGLDVLAISRHGYTEEVNESIMHLRTESIKIAETIKNNSTIFDRMKLRWICVLQKKGVNDVPTLERYLDWVAETGVSQICFKELYVSVSEESVYYDRSYNKFSRDNQVPLSMVVNYLESKGSKIISKLPWGSPVYQHRHNDRDMQIACYTEPSLFWERSTGICRSWNMMADGKIYVSLEDKASEIKL